MKEDNEIVRREKRRYILLTFCVSEQLYAEIVGALAAFVSLIYMIPFKAIIDIPFAFVIDAVLFVLWLAVFGVFGKVSNLRTSII